MIGDQETIGVKERREEAEGIMKEIITEEEGVQEVEGRRLEVTLETEIQNLKMTGCVTKYVSTIIKEYLKTYDYQNVYSFLSMLPINPWFTPFPWITIISAPTQPSSHSPPFSILFSARVTILPAELSAIGALFLGERM